MASSSNEKWVRFRGKGLYRLKAVSPYDPLVVYINNFMAGKWTRVPLWVAGYLGAITEQGQHLFQVADDPYEDISGDIKEINQDRAPAMKVPAECLEIHKDWREGKELLLRAVSELEKQVITKEDENLLGGIRDKVNEIANEDSYTEAVKYIKGLVDSSKLASRKTKKSTLPVKVSKAKEVKKPRKSSAKTKTKRSKR